MGTRRWRRAELQMPQLHDQILECVADFASPAKQDQWRRNDPSLPIFDTLNENWNALGDAVVFDIDCHTLIGVTLRDESEAAAMNNLAAALDAITDALGRMATPAQTFDHPLWPKVIQAAKEAESLLRRVDP